MSTPTLNKLTYRSIDHIYEYIPYDDYVQLVKYSSISRSILEQQKIPTQDPSKTISQISRKIGTGNIPSLSAEHGIIKPNSAYVGKIQLMLDEVNVFYAEMFTDEEFDTHYQDLQCRIHLTILKDPVVSATCLHTFERAVFETLLTSTGVCDLCNKQLANPIQDFKTKTAIDEAKADLKARLPKQARLTNGTPPEDLEEHFQADAASFDRKKTKKALNNLMETTEGHGYARWYARVPSDFCSLNLPYHAAIAHLNLLKFYIAENDYPNALTTINAMINGPRDEKISYRLYLLKAYLLFSQEDFMGAKSIVAQIQTPRDEDRSFFEQNFEIFVAIDPGPRIFEFLEALFTSELSKYHYYLLAASRLKSTDRESALAFCEKAISLMDNPPEAYVMKLQLVISPEAAAQTYLKLASLLENPKEQIACLKEARRRSKSPEILKRLIPHLAGSEKENAYLELASGEEKAQAVNTLEHASEEFPESVPILTTLINRYDHAPANILAQLYGVHMKRQEYVKAEQVAQTLFSKFNDPKPLLNSFAAQNAIKDNLKKILSQAETQADPAAAFICILDWLKDTKAAPSLIEYATLQCIKQLATQSLQGLLEIACSISISTCGSVELLGHLANIYWETEKKDTSKAALQRIVCLSIEASQARELYSDGLSLGDGGAEKSLRMQGRRQRRLHYKSPEEDNAAVGDKFFVKNFPNSNRMSISWESSKELRKAHIWLIEKYEDPSLFFMHHKSELSSLVSAFSNKPEVLLLLADATENATEKHLILEQYINTCDGRSEAYITALEKSNYTRTCYFDQLIETNPDHPDILPVLRSIKDTLEQQGQRLPERYAFLLAKYTGDWTLLMRTLKESSAKEKEAILLTLQSIFTTSSFSQVETIIESALEEGLEGIAQELIIQHICDAKALEVQRFCLSKFPDNLRVHKAVLKAIRRHPQGASRLERRAIELAERKQIIKVADLSFEAESFNECANAIVELIEIFEHVDELPRFLDASNLFLPAFLNALEKRQLFANPMRIEQVIGYLSQSNCTSALAIASKCPSPSTKVIDHLKSMSQRFPQAFANYPRLSRLALQHSEEKQPIAEQLLRFKIEAGNIAATTEFISFLIKQNVYPTLAFEVAQAYPPHQFPPVDSAIHLLSNAMTLDDLKDFFQLLKYQNLEHAQSFFWKLTLASNPQPALTELALSAFSEDPFFLQNLAKHPTLMDELKKSSLETLCASAARHQLETAAEAIQKVASKRFHSLSIDFSMASIKRSSRAVRTLSIIRIAHKAHNSGEFAVILKCHDLLKCINPYLSQIDDKTRSSYLQVRDFCLVHRSDLEEQKVQPHPVAIPPPLVYYDPDHEVKGTLLKKTPVVNRSTDIRKITRTPEACYKIILSGYHHYRIFESTTGKDVFSQYEIEGAVEIGHGWCWIKIKSKQKLFVHPIHGETSTSCDYYSCKATYLAGFILIKGYQSLEVIKTPDAQETNVPKFIKDQSIKDFRRLAKGWCYVETLAEERLLYHLDFPSISLTKNFEEVHAVETFDCHIFVFTNEQTYFFNPHNAKLEGLFGPTSTISQLTDHLYRTDNGIFRLTPTRDKPSITKIITAKKDSCDIRRFKNLYVIDKKGAETVIIDERSEDIVWQGLSYASFNVCNGMFFMQTPDGLKLFSSHLGLREVATYQFEEKLAKAWAEGAHYVVETTSHTYFIHSKTLAVAGKHEGSYKDIHAINDFYIILDRENAVSIYQPGNDMIPLTDKPTDKIRVFENDVATYHIDRVQVWNIPKLEKLLRQTPQ